MGYDPFPGSSEFVTTQSGQVLHYISYPGTGAKVFVLPGITSPAATWAFVAERLMEFCSPVVLDMRGRGLSSAPTDGYALSDYVDDLMSVIAKVGDEDFSILGHSLGARVALYFASQRPGYARRLAAVDPPLCGPGRPTYKTPLAVYLHQKKLVAADGGAEIRRRHPSWSETRIRERVEWLPTCSDVAIEKSYESMHGEDLWSLLPEISDRTLFLYAPDGGAVSATEAEEVNTLLPSCQVVPVQNSGHMIPWEQLDFFVEVVSDFFDC